MTFIDARTLPDGTAIQADLCIIGAGAAGITLAREFVGDGRSVAVIESGGLEFDAETQALAKGQNGGFPYYDLDAVRLRYFGGTTNHWAGACRPLDVLDLARRPWVPNSGWPFSRAHLEPYYGRAHDVCRLASTDYDPSVWETQESPALSLAGSPLRTALHQSNPIRFGEVYREEIRGAPNVDTYLYANVVELEAASAENRVERLRVATLNGRQLEVQARAYVLATGAIENARLLLASNGARAKGPGNENGLVGRHFMEHLSVPVGLFLPSRPDLPLGLYRGEGRYRGGTPPDVAGLGFLVPRPEVLRSEKMLNCRAFLSPLGLSRGDEYRYASPGVISAEALARSLKGGTWPQDLVPHIAKLIADVDDIAVFAYRYLRQEEEARGYYVTLHIEQVANPESRVELAPERDRFGMPRARVVWRFGELERHTMQRMVDLLARTLGAEGYGRIQVVPWDQDVDRGPFARGADPGPDWPPGVRGAWHQMGTTRMDPDPDHGVVDTDCRVHGLGNLFVAGSSVFPTPGYTNPTLTIIALALRMADRLKREIR